MLKLFFSAKNLNIIILIFLLQAGAFYVTSRPVQVAPQLNSLLELVTGDINYRYTDATKVFNGSSFSFLNAITVASVVPCSGRKTPSRT